MKNNNVIMRMDEMNIEFGDSDIINNFFCSEIFFIIVIYKI